MERFTVALFGEAQKGEFRTAYYCHSLDDLESYFGHPPPDSKGLFYAVQALLYHRDLIFFRVREEGYSVSDYLAGLGMLQSLKAIPLAAIGLPGVGNTEILDAIAPLCSAYHSILLTNEADLYDYLTA